jgi:esterase/lipase superfamily enzyme
MKRTYLKWFSPALGKEMEVLIFGHTGASVLFFPTRGARFYDYENWRVIEAMRHRIENGELQIYCVDSVDAESFYNADISPPARVKRHLQYERYIINEVIPFIRLNNTGSAIISAGCSMGAYHAVNIAFRHPHYFVKVVGMSGRYDLTHATGSFRDLLDGFNDEDVYFNMPNQYVANLTDQKILNQYRKMEIIFAIGEIDAFLNNNKHMHAILNGKGVKNQLYIWSEEAHRPRYWRKMVNFYI